MRLREVMKSSARSGFLSFTLVLASVALPRIASAADVRAETLYQEGRRAAHEKDWVTACKKFKESQERESAPGTVLNLADCEENRGKLVEAIAHFETAARLFPVGSDRAAYAHERASAVEKRLSRLNLSLRPSVATNTTVECDGVAIDPSRLGTMMPVDPGEHVILVRAPGRTGVRSTLKLAEGESRQIELDAGDALSSAKHAGPTEVNDRHASPPSPAGTPSPPPLRTLGFVSLGVGAVGLGVGLFGGYMMLAANGRADDHCSATGCKPEGLDAQNQGKTWSAVSTAGIVTAGVGLAAGVGLLVLAPSKRDPVGTLAARPIAGGSELSFAGSF